MLNWSKTYCNIYPNKCTGLHSNTTVVQNINWAILEMPRQQQENVFCRKRSPSEWCRRAGHLCLLILCERDYRCDTFGLGEEHLHKVWREVSRRKTRLMNRGKRSSNLTKPGSGNSTQGRRRRTGLLQCDMMCRHHSWSDLWMKTAKLALDVPCWGLPRAGLEGDALTPPPDFPCA